MDNTNQKTGMRMHSISPKYLKKIRTIINSQELLSSMEDDNTSLSFSYSLISDSFFIRNIKDQTEVTENYFICFHEYSFLLCFPKMGIYSVAPHPLVPTGGF